MINRFAQRAATLAALAMGVGLSGCSFNIEWDEVDGVALSEFDQSGDAPTELSLAGPDEVVITEGETLSISLEGSSEAGNALRFDRRGDELRIARDNNVFGGSDKAIIRITMPAPSGLEIAGSGKINSAVMASEADIDIAGSGAVSIAEVDADRLDIDLAGSGTVAAAGSVERLTIEMAGSSVLSLGDLMADDVKINIAGSGNVDVASNGIVDAEIAGSGNIVVTGSATCTLDSAGSGTMTCRPAPEAAASESEDDTLSAE